MRFACLVTVCAALTTTLCSATATPPKRYQAQEYRMPVESRNSTLTSDVSHHPDDFIFVRDMPSRRVRKAHQVQVFPTRQYSSRGSTRARSRRQLRKISTRSLPISRSLDVTQNQNQIESIQSPETFDDGAIHIEPLYRVSKKKGIWDSLMDILHRVVSPPKTHLGPLIGPLHVPGIGDKVYIRLLEPPESNHLVIKVVSHVPPPHEIEVPPHLPSVTTLVKSPEAISIDHHHSSFLSPDILSGSPGHLPEIHPTSVDLSLDSFSDLSEHHSTLPVSPLPDFLPTPSNQYRQVNHPPVLLSTDSHVSSSNQHQQVRHPSGSLHSDNAPSSSNHQYRHARPTVLSQGVVHGSSKTVMKIPKSKPTTYKPPKEHIRPSRMFKGKHKQNFKPPSPTIQTLSSTSIPPTKAANIQHEVRIEANRQSPPPTKVGISNPNAPQASHTENREPFFHSFQFENSDFKPFYGEQFNPPPMHHQYRPTPAVEIHEFNHNDVLRPKTTQPSIALNPLFADNPSSPVTRVSRIAPGESSTPKTHIGNGQAFEMVRAPSLAPTYPSITPHHQFMIPQETIDTSPTKFNLFNPMDAQHSKPWSEKPAKSKEVKPAGTTPNVSSRTSVSQSRNSTWESVKMRHANQTRTEVRMGKVLSEVTPTSNDWTPFESYVTLPSVRPSIASMIRGPTVIPLVNSVNITSTILPVNTPVSRAPTVSPVTHIATSSHNIISLSNPAPKVTTVVSPSGVPAVVKKSQGKGNAKCLKCQQAKEKKVEAVINQPSPRDSIFHGHVPLLTRGNATPAAKVSSSSSNGARPPSSTATAKPVLVSSTTKKPLPKRPKPGSNLPQKLMPNNSLRKAVSNRTTRKTGFVANTTTNLPISTTSSSTSSSSTTRKSVMPASDFKKRLEMWKKNRKV